MELTRDLFLDGRLDLVQPRRGYRAATDPVLLAASVPAEAGASVLDIGCGVGTALYCLMRRVPGLTGTGLELQPDYCDLARRNGPSNDLQAEIIEGNLARPPDSLRTRQFDHVLTNPPFHEPASSGPRDMGRDIAHREAQITLPVWIEQCLRRVRPKGTFSIIQRAGRLHEILAALHTRAGDIRILPIASRSGRVARRVLVQASKGSRSPLTLHPPLIMHDGPVHVEDGDDFSSEARRILREGGALAL